MTQLRAVYQGGVFKPLEVVDLSENQHVRLSIEPIETYEVRAWLATVLERQQRIIAERGCFPDTTSDIAADRRHA